MDPIRPIKPSDRGLPILPALREQPITREGRQPGGDGRRRGRDPDQDEPEATDDGEELEQTNEPASLAPPRHEVDVYDEPADGGGVGADGGTGADEVIEVELYDWRGAAEVEVFEPHSPRLGPSDKHPPDASTARPTSGPDGARPGRDDGADPPVSHIDISA
jgi:hypothetical protein